MSQNLTNAIGNLKNVYDNYIETQQNLEHRAIDEIGKSLEKYSPGGAGFFGAVRTQGNESVGAINEEETFRSIDYEITTQWKVSPKIQVGPIQFSGLVAEAANTDEEAFVSAVVNELDMARDRLLKDENRQFFGYGTGQLAVASGAAAAGVTSFSVASAQYLRANMVVDIYNGATLTIAGARISDVDKISNVVFLATTFANGYSAAAQVVKQNIRVSAPSDGKELMGLNGIVDNNTLLQTFQSIDSAANRIWRGVVIPAALANLTSDLLQRLLDDTEVLGGKRPDTLILHPLQRRQYLNLVVPQKRYADGEMDTGFKKLMFNEIELWLDPDCQVDTVYAISKKLLRKFELAPMKMGTHDGSDAFLRLANQDVFQAYWRHYVNFGTSKRNAHGKLNGLSVPNGIN